MYLEKNIRYPNFYTLVTLDQIYEIYKENYKDRDTKFVVVPPFYRFVEYCVRKYNYKVM